MNALETIFNHPLAQMGALASSLWGTYLLLKVSKDSISPRQNILKVQDLQAQKARLAKRDRGDTNGDSEPAGEDAIDLMLNGLMASYQENIKYLTTVEPLYLRRGLIWIMVGFAVQFAAHLLKLLKL